MAGIYIHIPFCKKACFYCDFHFTVSLDHKDEVVSAIQKEAVSYASDFKSESIESIYFGGGTPSVLSAKEVAGIIETLESHYVISKNAEITLEANPDDLSYAYLASLKEIGINRLSIGIQTLDDQLLIKLNRSHDAQRALDCLKDCKTLGFNTINADVIYGIPGQSIDLLEGTIKQIVAHEVHHISAYHLTIEPGTVFGRWSAAGKLKAIDESISEQHFQQVLKQLRFEGFEQYEISNFCRNNQFSKHNSSYWKSQHYLGLGPAAHSFYGNKRRWNVANNVKYVQGIQSQQFNFEAENLDVETKYNEYIMTRLRTYWGVDKAYIKSHFGDQLNKHFLLEFSKLKMDWFESNSEGNVVLTDAGKLVSNFIFEKLMYVE